MLNGIDEISGSRATLLAAVVAVAVAGVLVGCPVTPVDDDEEQACVEGEQTDCTCRDGTESVQVCLDDGTFGACECDDNGNGNGDDSALGPDGGTVVGPDGLEVEVSQGALDEEVTVDIEEVEQQQLPETPLLVSVETDGWTIEAPDALFDASPTVRIPFDEETNYPVGLWAGGDDETLTVDRDDEKTRQLHGDNATWEMEPDGPVEWVAGGSYELFWEPSGEIPEDDVVDFTPRGVTPMENEVYAAGDSTVYYTYDTGESWEAMGTDGALPAGVSIRALGGEIDLYAGTTDGVWQLEHSQGDDHSEWKSFGDGLPGGVTATAMAEEDGEDRLAGLEGGGVYRAPDEMAGEDTDDDWIVSGLTEAGTITALVQIAGTGVVASAGGDGLYLMESDDQWDQVATSPENPRVIQPVGGGFVTDLLVGSDDGVWFFDADEETTEPRNDGFDELVGAKPEIADLAAHPDDLQFAATGDDGVFVAEYDGTDQIGDWQPASYGLGDGGATLEVHAVHVATTSTGNTVGLVGTSEGLYRAVEGE